MATTATAQKTPAPAPIVPTPVREHKLREAQLKRLPPGCIVPLGYGETQIVTVTAPTGITFADVMTTAAWAGASGTIAKDKLNSRNLQDGKGIVIMLDTADETFHAWLRVKKVVRDKMNNPCGLDLLCIGPSMDPKTGEARPIDLATGKAWSDPASE